MFDLLSLALSYQQSTKSQSNSINKSLLSFPPFYLVRTSFCFRWLNKLGMAAQHGYKVVIRQSMFQGEYSLVGEDLEPNPVSLLALSPCSHHAFSNLWYDWESFFQFVPSIFLTLSIKKKIVTSEEWRSFCGFRFCRFPVTFLCISSFLNGNLCTFYENLKQLRSNRGVIKYTYNWTPFVFSPSYNNKHYYVRTYAGTDDPKGSSDSLTWFLRITLRIPIAHNFRVISARTRARAHTQHQ